MLDCCFGPQWRWRIRRILRNGKLTVFCLVLTVIVIRGNLGVGKFGTPQQDFIEIRNHFYSGGRRFGPRRVLEEAQTTTIAAAAKTTTVATTDSNNYAAFDISKILVDEGEDESPSSELDGSSETLISPVLLVPISLGFELLGLAEGRLWI